MVINGYDTTIGKPLKVKEHVESTIKALSIRNDLYPTTRANVFSINTQNAMEIPQFPLPITLTGYDRKNITVYDERFYRNKNNVVVNEPELQIMRLTAYLQQDAMEGDYGVINAQRFICIKGVAGAIATQFKGLDLEESSVLRIILGHYINCLFERDTEELAFISANAIKTAFNIDIGFSQRIVDDVGYIDTPVKLLNAIKNEPSLFKLKEKSLTELIGACARITFSGLGTGVTAVMLESPLLMIGFIYATCTNRLYAKTALGLQLDPKFNKKLVDTFLNSISSNYDLSRVS